ncbi:MAG: hypothetical protein IPK83_12670 [Planctomycetes bacterium]|nr:hypothetical protein [Planctomycetota bacterium]
MRILSRGLPAIVFLLSAATVSRAEETIDKLLKMMPGDVGFVIVVERPQHAFPPAMIEPVLKAIAPNEKSAGDLLEALKKIPGPFVIGMLPRPDKETGEVLDTVVAMAIERPDSNFEDWCEKLFLPAAHAMSESANDKALRVERGEGTLRIMSGVSDEMVLGFAVKDKVAFGSNKANRVLRWRKGEYPKKAWVAMPGVRRLLKSLPKESNVRLLVNPRAFVDAMPKPRKNSWDELVMNVIAPEEIEAIAVDLTWEKRTIRIRATASLAESCKGIGRILSRASTECRQIGIFPEDFAMIGRLGWSSAQGVMDGLYSITDLFDKTISNEHREDLATFETETGLNWDADVLGQMVGEAAFGIRVDFTRKNPIGWATVFPLGDHTVFSRQIDQLISHFELPVESADRDGMTIHNGGERMPIAFAIIRDTFMVADSPETILDLAKGAGKQNGEPIGKGMRACYKKLEKPNQMVVMLDLETLMQKAPIIMMGAGPKLGPLISNGSISFAMGPGSRKPWPSWSGKWAGPRIDQPRSAANRTR